MRIQPTFWFLACLALVGCSGAQGLEVAGNVTFDGKPLPAGRIYFDADTTKGNDGPQGFAQIHDGKYDTRQGGRGAWGGPTVVLIQGYEAGPPAEGDAPRAFGKLLFREHKITIDLPKESCTRDFEVPASAAKSRPLPPTKAPI